MGPPATEDLHRQLEELRRRLAEFVSHSNDLDSRLMLVENSRLFRLARWPGRTLLDWKGRLGQRLLHSRLHPLYLRLARPRGAVHAYQRWVERERAATRPQQQLSRQPSIGIVLPVHNPTRAWLEAAVDSVRNQTYPRWELLVCDDASADAWPAAYFAGLAADPRIRLVRSDAPLGISGASNRAGALGVSDYVGLLDQDDVLAPDALYHVAAALQQGDADLVYSDEDRLDAEGRRVEPNFKPAWSPELLLGCMYLGHFMVMKRSALDRAGWFRPAFDGSQDYDLALRVTEVSGTVLHIPRVLYHWRKHPGSTASAAGSKPYAHAAGRKALEEAVARRGWTAAVEDGPIPSSYRVRRRVAGDPRASLIIPSRQPRLLERCRRAIEACTSWPHREIVAVRHPEGEPFNFSRFVNRGARDATGEILVFLNDDVEPLEPNWLTELVAQAQRPEVGAVGARLLYPSGAIQHAGLAIGIMRGVGHIHRDTFASAWWNWMAFPRNVSAVTGACLAMRRAVFEQLGGFDEAFAVNYNDADLCLRARQAGYEVIYEPAAVLRHYECQTRAPGIRYAELEMWQDRWAARFPRCDPYYSPNLTNVREDASLRADWPAEEELQARRGQTN